MSQEVNYLKHTSCKECTFAEYEGKTQVGCSQNRLDIFKSRNNILDAYDEEKEFYIVNNERCNHFIHNSNRENKQFIEQCLNSIKTKFCAIIFARNDMQSTKDTLISIKNQLGENRVAEIFIIREPGEFEDGLKYTYILKDLFPSDVTWHISNMERVLDTNKYVDTILHHIKKRFHYFFILESGQELEQDIIKTISDKLENESLIYSAIDYKDIKFYNYSLYACLEVVEKMNMLDYLYEYDEPFKSRAITICTT